MQQARFLGDNGDEGLGRRPTLLASSCKASSSPGMTGLVAPSDALLIALAAPIASPPLHRNFRSNLPNLDK